MDWYDFHLCRTWQFPMSDIILAMSDVVRIMSDIDDAPSIEDERNKFAFVC